MTFSFLFFLLVVGVVVNEVKAQCEQDIYVPQQQSPDTLTLINRSTLIQNFAVMLGDATVCQFTVTAQGVTKSTVNVKIHKLINGYAYGTDGLGDVVASSSFIVVAGDYENYTAIFTGATIPVQRGTRLAAVFTTTGTVRFYSQSRASVSSGVGGAFVVGEDSYRINNLQFTSYIKRDSYCQQKLLQCFNGTYCESSICSQDIWCTNCYTKCYSVALANLCVDQDKYEDQEGGDVQNKYLVSMNPNMPYMAQVFPARSSNFQVSVVFQYYGDYSSTETAFYAQIVNTTELVPNLNSGISAKRRYTIRDVAASTNNFAKPFLMNFQTSAAPCSVVALEIGAGDTDVGVKIAVTPESSFSGLYNYYQLSEGRYGYIGGASLVFATFSPYLPSPTPAPTPSGSTTTGPTPSSPPTRAPTSPPPPSCPVPTIAPTSTPTIAPTSGSNTGPVPSTVSGNTGPSPTSAPTSGGSGNTGPAPTTPPSSGSNTGPAPTVPPSTSSTTSSSNTGTNSGSNTGPAPTSPSTRAPTTTPSTTAPVVFSVAINVTITVTAENRTSVDIQAIAAAFAARLGVSANDVNVIIREVGQRRAARFEVIVVIKTIVSDATSALTNSSAIQATLKQEITNPTSTLNAAVAASGSVSIESVSVAATSNTVTSTTRPSPSSSPSSSNAPMLSGATRISSVAIGGLVIFALLNL